MLESLFVAKQIGITATALPHHLIRLIRKVDALDATSIFAALSRYLFSISAF